MDLFGTKKRRQIESVGTQAKANVAAQQAELAGQQAAYERAVHDQQGPDFEPIAGVNLRNYAELLVDQEMARFGAPPPDEVQRRSDESLRRHGLTEDVWLHDVVAGWQARVVNNPVVAQAVNNAVNDVRRGA